MTLQRLMRPLVLAAALLAAAPAAAEDYVQAGGALTFATSYQGETFVGDFPGFRSTMRFDPARPQDARLEVVIPLGGASTDDEDRDGTLQGAAFFNVATFPEARYTAQGFTHRGGDSYSTDGVLELRGVSQPVTLTFTWEPGDHPTLSGRATVDRLAFDIGAGMWADTSVIPAEIAISTRVVFRPAP